MRPISKIAEDILHAWPRPNYAAKPYLEAMQEIETMSDSFGADSAKSIILYFLSNAQSFRGEKARELKAELKAML